MQLEGQEELKQHCELWKKTQVRNVEQCQQKKQPEAKIQITKQFEKFLIVFFSKKLVTTSKNNLEKLVDLVTKN